MKERKTFITFRVENRKKIIDFGNNNLYLYGEVEPITNKTKGSIDISFEELHPFCSKLYLLFKMLFTKNFVFAEVK